jgi:hypothetical protein
LQEIQDRHIVELDAFIDLRLFDRGERHAHRALADLVPAPHGILHGLVELALYRHGEDYT